MTTRIIDTSNITASKYFSREIEIGFELSAPYESVKCSSITDRSIAFQVDAHTTVSRKTLGRMISDVIVLDGRSYVFDYMEPAESDTSDWGYDGRDERWMNSSAPTIVIMFKEKE